MASVATPDGKYLLVMNAGAHPPAISVIDLASAKELSRMPLPDAWLGMTMTKAGDRVYVSGGSQAAVYEFRFANGVLTPGRMFPVVAEKDRTPQDFVGDVRLSPDGRLIYAAMLHRDAVVVMNPQSGLILTRIKTGRRPYRILFHPSGKTFYVSSWADGSVGQYDVNSGSRLASFSAAPHPTDMVWLEGGVEGQPEIRARMFVAGANTNSVYVMAASESGDLTRLETINLAMTARQPLGMTPSALGLSGDGKLLYAACSNQNAVAVIDITGERSRITGFIPAGAYPTAVAALADGRIVVLNGHSDSVQLTDKLDEDKLLAYTNQVSAASPYKDDKLTDNTRPEGSPVRASSPIKHVIYVVRDASAGAAPNREKLAREFVSLGNFHTLGANKAEDVGWATAAIAPDYATRLSQNSEAGRRAAYDYEGQDPASLPPAGYLWNAVSQAGLKTRNYGFQVHNRAKPTPDGEQVDVVYDPALKASTDLEYRGPDAAYPDAERAKEFAEELKEYGELGEMPQLLLVRIGSDDQALGAIAEAVTKSRFWSDTAIFVVDSGGSALVISPWAKRTVADNTPYDQMSLLRTIEVILGLRPITQFDAAATPMYGVFANAATVTPFTPVAGR